MPPDEARNGQGKRYRARWVDDDGRERSASFAAEKATKAHLKSVARGEYANTNGRMTDLNSLVVRSHPRRLDWRDQRLVENAVMFVGVRA